MPGVEHIHDLSPHSRPRLYSRSLQHPPYNLLFPYPVVAPVMSQTTSTAQASSRFQAIFQSALKSYQKQTKKDLIAHPLASQLQSCNSTAAIVAVLQDQVREFDKSRSGDDRLTKWLSPTVNVISAFSATVSGGVGLVSLDTRANVSLETSPDVNFVGIFACNRNLRRCRCLTFSEYPVYPFRRILLTLRIL